MHFDVSGKHVVLFSLGFVVFDVFRTVWVLYNIKREGGHTSEVPPPGGCPRETLLWLQPHD